MKKELKNPFFWIIFWAIAELAILLLALVIFFIPTKKLYIPFYILNFAIPIFVILFKSRYEILGFASLTLMFHGFIMLPAMLVILIRIICDYFQSLRLLLFFCTGFLFIIPLSVKELKKAIFIDGNSGFKKEENIKFDILIQLISTAFFRLILLVIIQFTDYLDIQIPFIKDIYSGIVFSLTYDAFFRPFIKKIQQKRISDIMEMRNAELQKRNLIIKEALSSFFKDAEKDIHPANKFLDLLSIHYGGLTLSSIERIDWMAYIYIKKSCSGFFDEYPYMKESELTTTYLFVWSEGKILPDVPLKSFGF